MPALLPLGHPSMTKTPKIDHVFRLAAIINELCSGKETTWEPTALARLILEHPASRWAPSTNQSNEPSMTPSPELIRDIRNQAPGNVFVSDIGREASIIDAAYQAGADAELEACVEWLGDAPVVWGNNDELHPGSFLRDARRPKPPSLKQQALQAIAAIEGDFNTVGDRCDMIRKALEALPDD